MLVEQNLIAANAMMEHNDTYKISFYTAGSNEPSIVIECSKSMVQKMSAEDLKSLNKAVDASKSYTMYIGEVTRILMK